MYSDLICILKNCSAHILLVISLVLLGCEDTQTEAQISLSTQYPPTSEYPHGYADVKIGNHILRVPKEVASVGPRGDFAVYRLWPEFAEAKNSSRSSPAQVFIDKIEIFFRPPSYRLNALPIEQQGINARERNLQGLIHLKENYEVRESEEFVGYWAYYDKYGKPFTYIAKDTDIIGPQGLPIRFHCSTINLEIDWDSQIKTTSGFPQCGYIAYWEDGHAIRIRFRRKHMQDAVEIYQKVKALHDSMIVKVR